MLHTCTKVTLRQREITNGRISHIVVKLALHFILRA